MKRLFAYGRASTDKQQITLKHQEEICVHYHRLRQAQGDVMEWAGWFPDAAITSRIPWFERPMGERIFSQIQPGDVIVVSNLDRAVRSVSDCDNSMMIAEEGKFALVFLDMEVDMRTITGRLFMRIVSCFKQFEREERSRQTRSALVYNLSHGKPHSQTDPIGWVRKGKSKELRASPEDRAWAKEVVRLYEERGYDFREIEKIFRQRQARTPNGNVWHLRRVRLAYSAVKCHFPKLYSSDLPPIKALRRYMASHGGRPPQLQYGLVRSGLWRNAPPMQDLPEDADAQAAS